MNRKTVKTVKDREGNLTDCILTSITNCILVDNAEIDNNRLINNNTNAVKHPFDLGCFTPNHHPNHPLRTKGTVPTQFSLALDDFELISLSEMGSGSEDCWLYKPNPKHISSVNPHHWVQGGFRDLEVQLSDPSLLQTLSAIYPKNGGRLRNPRVLRRPNRSTIAIKSSESVRSSASSPSRQQGDDQIQLNRTYDKKDLQGMFAELRQGDGPGQKSDDGAAMSKPDRISSGERRREERRRDARSGVSLESCPQDAGNQMVVDMSDVQMLAKMQEDSLRKSFSNSSSRSIKSELNKSTGHLLDSCGQGSPLHRSTHSSPGRSCDLKETRRSRTGLMSASSDSVSPRESLLDVGAPSNKIGLAVSTPQQQSLPNLLKDGVEPLPHEGPLDRTSTPSDESLDAASACHSLRPARRSGLKQPVKRTVAPPTKSERDQTLCSKESPDFTPKGGIIPPKGGISPPKAVASSIPKPNSVSKIRLPSKIATMRRALGTAIQTDSSWREGCF